MEHKAVKVVLNISVDRPYMTLKEYGDMLGVSEGTVQGWARGNYIKVKKIGKRVMVNNMAESIEAAAQADIEQVMLGGGQ